MGRQRFGRGGGGGWGGSHTRTGPCLPPMGRVAVRAPPHRGSLGHVHRATRYRGGLASTSRKRASVRGPQPHAAVQSSCAGGINRAQHPRADADAASGNAGGGGSQWLHNQQAGDCSMTLGGGHEATDTGLTYAPVSQAHGHHHTVECFALLHCSADQFCTTPGGF